MGKQHTSANETEEGKRRKVMADKQEDGVTTRDGAGRGKSVGQLSTASLCLFKTQGGVLWLGSIAPLRLSQSEPPMGAQRKL